MSCWIWALLAFLSGGTAAAVAIALLRAGREAPSPHG